MASRLMRVLALVVSIASIALVGAIGLGTTAAAPPNRGASMSGTVTGTAVDPATGATSDIRNGVFNVTNFAVQDGKMVATGTLTGTIGDQAIPPNTQVTMPVNDAASQASCQILDLVLGPLDLDLLGLQVHLDTVHLNITAQQGPGNLLGNLLCAVAGLLDGPASPNALQQIVNLLNQILGALG